MLNHICTTFCTTPVGKFGFASVMDTRFFRSTNILNPSSSVSIMILKKLDELNL